MTLRSVFPRRYFSKGVIPYWTILVWDCVAIVAAGLISVYITLGPEEVVNNFFEYIQIWVNSLPIFILLMFLFRTYGGVIAKTMPENLVRVWVALIIGGLILQGASAMGSNLFFPFRPPVGTTVLTIIIAASLQCLYRIVAKQMIPVDENGKVKAFITSRSAANSKKDIEDKSLRSGRRINLCLAHMSEEELEKKYVNEAFDTNWVVPLGPNVNAFEEDLENFVNKVEGKKFKAQGSKDYRLDSKVAALSSGTAAIHLALIAEGIGHGDEVCVQSFTFCASTNPIAYLGAFPVLIDSEPKTWNMDPELLEHAIKDRIAKTGKKPRAIIPVALYGMPYQIDKIMEIGNRYGIPVIEDAAEGFGSRFMGQVLGTFGIYGVLSFNGNKMITTSGGGALVCNGERELYASPNPATNASEGDEQSLPAPEDYRKHILWYATQAREAYPYYQHEAVGYNYRLSNVCAGIGRGQMSVLDDHLKHHKHVQQMYEELLADVPGITVHRAPSNAEIGADPNEPQVCDSNYWLCIITLDPSLKIKGQENAYKQAITGAVGGAAGVIHAVDSTATDCQPNENVEALRLYLDAAQIEARPVWKPMHKQPVFRHAPAYVNGVSESLFKAGMCLPAGPMVSDEDVKYIVQCIKDAII